jgi:hypothetical protein
MTRGFQRGLLVSAVSVVVLVASSCGGQSVIAVRVGSVAISNATLDHWEFIARHESKHSRFTPREHALDFLIFSHWLIGEASQRHLAIAGAEVSRRLELTRLSSFYRAEAKYFRSLKQTGRTPADVRFEIEAEIAYGDLRSSVILAASHVRPAEIAAYYRAHRRTYRVSERRYFDIDNLKTGPAALKVKREVEAGKSLAPIALREALTRATAFRQPGKVAIERAIFAAKPGELIGPIVIEPFKVHSIFIIRRIVPFRYKTLAEVRSQIKAHLSRSKQPRALAQFNAAWRKKWTAATDCHPRFIVQECRQYRGPQRPNGVFMIERSGLWEAAAPTLPG